MNQATCVTNYENSDYHCACAVGYVGKHCEIGILDIKLNFICSFFSLFIYFLIYFLIFFTMFNNEFICFLNSAFEKLTERKERDVSFAL